MKKAVTAFLTCLAVLMMAACGREEREEDNLIITDRLSES